ncbi:outer membrane protein assembly factor BamE [Parvibium lacunae]|uniref:Outer membrane protein assembly factor BamE n=2 Tax=Parvibium lacunae TaxID=1888893 RepID=A0A368KYH3_9BURK|nr:outer membrane protein assembly factor BamE [Parvibium lacunae]
MGILAWLLGGCSDLARELDPFMQLKSGMSGAQVIDKVGPPQYQQAMPTGEIRWDYTLGPEGQQNYFLWFDGTLNFQRLEPLLSRQNFSQIHTGMTAMAVREKLGPYFYERVYPFKEGVTREWRFADTPSSQTELFYIEFDAQERVQATGYRPDPRQEHG